ncbi:hypothetical protein M9458_053898, partial [Cirrhinus mrigala]
MVILDFRSPRRKEYSVDCLSERDSQLSRINYLKVGLFNIGLLTTKCLFISDIVDD